MPGLTTDGSKYDAIPGPLGLASASLEGKVALVTGAGKNPIRSKVFARELVAFVPVVCQWPSLVFLGVSSLRRFGWLSEGGPFRRHISA
jgi:hypothetical protein